VIRSCDSPIFIAAACKPKVGRKTDHFGKYGKSITLVRAASDRKSFGAPGREKREGPS
jgi:hypothetical protein